MLGELNLDYKRAVELAQRQKRATQGVKDLKNKQDTEDVTVHKVSNPALPGTTCYRCGNTGHFATSVSMARTSCVTSVDRAHAEAQTGR